MKRNPWVTISLLVMAVSGLIAFGLIGCTSSPSTTTSSAPTTSVPSPGTTTAPPATSTAASGPVTINLIAKNIAFNLSTITVPAGAQVTVNFDNQDSGLPHNFSVYQSGSKSSGTATGPIFTGQIITGPAKTTYTFTTPTTPGTYFFRCDVHPTIMTGTFVVK